MTVDTTSPTTKIIADQISFANFQCDCLNLIIKVDDMPIQSYVLLWDSVTSRRNHKRYFIPDLDRVANNDRYAACTTTNKRDE